MPLAMKRGAQWLTAADTRLSVMTASIAHVCSRWLASVPPYPGRRGAGREIHPLTRQCRIHHAVLQTFASRGLVQTIATPTEGGDMADPGDRHSLGWLGTGRMGVALVQRLLRAGRDVTVYNRTRAKAEPLCDAGARLADSAAELGSADIVFVMVGTSQVLIDAVTGPAGLISRGRAPMDVARPYLDLLGAGATYVGDGELARIVKLCHNLVLGVVTQSLAEVAVLAEKSGISRQALLACLNNSVMGSTFSRYKTPAL